MHRCEGYSRGLEAGKARRGETKSVETGQEGSVRRIRVGENWVATRCERD